MRVVVDQNVPLGQEAFQDAGQVVLVPGRHLRREDLRGCEILIVRSITKVTPKLLEGTSVRFVGTCTIGTDHLDIPWLESEGIYWTAAPGCNARSVAEWTVSALATAHLRKRLDLAQKIRAGVVGVGKVGSQVATLLETLGFQVLRNDPPRAKTEGGHGFSNLDEILQSCAVVTSHLPMVRDGQWPTKALWAKNLEKLRPGTVFLNSGRGPTASTPEVLQVLKSRPDVFAVLDVFDPEPSFPGDLATRADLVSPHVAGYSLEGKIEGTRLVREELAGFLGLRPWSPPPPKTLPLDVRSLRLPDGHLLSPSTPVWDALAALVVGAHDPSRDDTAMRSLILLSENERASGFDKLRKDYPERLEWRHRPVQNTSSLPAQAWEIAQKLGFVEA